MKWNAPTGIAYAGRSEALFRPAAEDNFFRLYQPRTPQALCAEMARLAYCDFARVLVPALERVSYKLVDAPFERAPLQGFVAEGPAGAVLVFRGSSAPLDWITNLNAAPVGWRGGGRVHRGFAKALEPVWPEIARQIEKVLGGAGGPLLITGHSLGAALATLSAGLIPAGRLITFGSPKVGDSAFCRSVRAAERYVNNRDVVCRLPLPGLPMVKAYRHVGRLHFIGPDGREQAAPDPAEVDHIGLSLRRLRRVLEDRAALRRLPRDLMDHAPLNYVAAVA